jgi:Ion channel regulatory protein UNC-93
VNRLGIKLTLSFGGLGYCIYAISLLASEHADVAGFNIFAGALLGVCAALLWTAQGTIMLSYPFEAQKGKYFAWFWTIFNLGGVIGSLVGLDISCILVCLLVVGERGELLLLLFTGVAPGGTQEN